MGLPHREPLHDLQRQRQELECAPLRQDVGIELFGKGLIALAAYPALSLLVQRVAFALPVVAQDADVVVITDEEFAEAERAAGTMVEQLYVRDLPTYWTPREVVERLQELGYTNIHDFDVEWSHYEVEAYVPNGEDVEVEVDPVTGQILDVEENWF